jgi:uroporphyrin-3 C-methyltransferase
MNKNDSSSDNGNADESPQIETETELPALADAVDSEPADSVDAEPVPAKTEEKQEEKTKPGPKPAPRRSWLGIFNLLLIIAMAAAAGYYWQLQQQLQLQAELEYQETIADLELRISSKMNRANIDSSLAPLRADIDLLGGKIGQLDLNQQDLQASSEKLYDLYGRDKNDWQLAEVEYLMRVAQHKLILENDFEGAAVTLQAASDKIARTGDPGLLPVRVLISEEIAELKTRKRPDLVGMTLILAQLGRQAKALQPGFAPRVDTSSIEALDPVSEQGSWIDQLSVFVDSLITVRHQASQPSEIEASIVDVGETLEDNLKLARWAVLERDAHQYRQLIDQSLRLFSEFYNLDDAANNDFYTQLQSLQKSVIKAEKPDITGSLLLLQLILSKRENAPEVDTPEVDTPGVEVIGND